MLDLLPTITSLPIADVIVKSDRLRGVSEAEVLALVEIILEFGQTTPILVRRTKAGFVLVDGLHRLEASRRAGLTDIPARCYTMTDEDAEMLEASQNLIGGMSPLDDAVFLPAGKRPTLINHPETAGGVAGGMAKAGLQRNSSSFAEVVAEKRAISVRQVRKIISAGERLRGADLAQLRTAERPVTLKDIEVISKIADAEERSMVVLRLAVGNAKSASDARRTLRAESGDMPAPVNPADKAFNDLLKAWKRAPMTAKKRFLFEHSKEVWVCQNAGAALKDWANAKEIDPKHWESDK